jgi:hypothetical protein
VSSCQAHSQSARPLAAFNVENRFEMRSGCASVETSEMRAGRVSLAQESQRDHLDSETTFDLSTIPSELRVRSRKRGA